MIDRSSEILLEMHQLALTIVAREAQHEDLDILPRDYAALLDQADTVFSAANVLLALNQIDIWKDVALKHTAGRIFTSGFESGHRLGKAGTPLPASDIIETLLPDALHAAAEPSESGK